MPREIKPKFEPETNLNEEDKAEEEIVAGNVERVTFDINKILVVFLIVLVLVIIGVVVFILKPWEPGFTLSDIKDLF